MHYTKIICTGLIALLLSITVSAQFGGVEISAGVGVPLFSEEYHLEKSLDTITHRECQGLRRSGYYSRGSLNYNLGVTAKYDLKSFSFFSGVSYTFFGYSEWAIPDSAIKYALCPDPFISWQRSMNCVNIPIGIAYSFKKLKLGVSYGIPIITFIRDEYGHYSNITEKWNNVEWFYENSGISNQKYYFQYFLQYQFTEPFALQFSYKTNSGKRLNHLAFGVTYSFGAKT